MLELRPNCELCDKNLPANCMDANICSYECTYCTDCVDKVLCNVCPTCGGGFTRRPVRPQTSWRPERKLGLKYHPPSAVRVHTEFAIEDIRAHIDRIKDLAPDER